MAELENIKEIVDKKSDKLENKPSYTCDKCGSDGHPTESHGKIGGRRSNSGKPKGSLSEKQKTLMAVKKDFQQRVAKVADKLFEAQYNKAIGERYLYHKWYTGEGKNKKKHVEMVTDPNIIEMYINDELENDLDDGEWYWMSTKPANNNAIEGLLNRSFGKASEKVEIEGGFFNATKMIIEVVGEDSGEQDRKSIEAEVKQQAKTSPPITK